MRIELPEGKEPVTYVWGEMVPAIGHPAAAFSSAVYEHSTLALREFEAARLRIAQVNGCVFCLDWRTDRAGERVPDSFPDAIAHWADATELSERERLASEYADRFATDHHGLDDAFWARMRAAYSDVEIVELTMCLGSWIAFGRLNRVLGIDEVCVLPSHWTR
ncbi:MAG TPA: carboxymuconolactone decarboxylase family protein [Acidimicrobiia bacterium]|nr:carboxymuconolactone decarboxylase family protein [Acidimicrobiia bacterium]